MSIEEAIEAVSGALRAGASEKIVALTLIDDGFKPEKAQIIIRWAKQYKKSA
jgi:hypothetical protein